MHHRSPVVYDEDQIEEERSSGRRKEEKINCIMKFDREKVLEFSDTFSIYQDKIERKR